MSLGRVDGFLDAYIEADLQVGPAALPPPFSFSPQSLCCVAAGAAAALRPRGAAVAALCLPSPPLGLIPPARPSPSPALSPGWQDQ